MPCLTCLHWRGPQQDRYGKQVGTCGRDQSPAHAHYTCQHHESIGGAGSDITFTDDEIAWLRLHPDAPQRVHLVALYEDSRTAPPETRKEKQIVLAEALAEWRGRRLGPPRVPPEPVPPDNIACDAMITGAHECGWPRCRCEIDRGFKADGEIERQADQAETERFLQGRSIQDP